MVRTLKCLAFFHHISIALAGDPEDAYSVYLPNFYKMGTIDFGNSELEHSAPREGNIVYATTDPSAVQLTYSNTGKKSFDLQNITDTSFDQSYTELCSSKTYFDLSNNAVYHELETPVKYHYDYNNPETIYSVPLNSTPISDVNGDALKCCNERTYRDIIPSQSHDYPESLVENNETGISSINSDINCANICRSLKCSENSILFKFSSQYEYLQSEVKNSTEISQRESQVLTQELADFNIDGNDHSSVHVLDQSSLQPSINNTSHDDQKKKFDINTKSKKRKLNTNELAQKQNKDLIYNSDSETRQNTKMRRLGKRKSTTGRDKQTNIMITEKINNLYYYVSLAESLGEREINITDLKNKNKLKILQKKHKYMLKLKDKTIDLFKNQELPSSVEVENLKLKLSSLDFSTQNTCINIDAIDHSFLSEENFLIKDVRKNNFVRSLFRSKNKELKKKNSPGMDKVSTKFLKKSDNFIEKEIELLNNTCKNQKNTKIETIKPLPIYLFKCQNECLMLIITNIFYFYCTNKYNGDEGCIIKPTLFQKIHEFCELPKFLDLVFITDYSTITSSINEITIVLNSFRTMSKVLYDVNFQDCKFQHLYKFRLHILQYLKLVYGKSTTFALYSHVMASDNRIKSPKAKNSPLTAILYFSFFTITMEFKYFETLSFFYSNTLDYFFVSRNAKLHEGLLCCLICIKKVNEMFMSNFNKYLIKCLCNCGNKTNDYEESYYLYIMSRSVALIKPCENNIDNFYYEICNNTTFIHKLINCYYEMIKKI